MHPARNVKNQEIAYNAYVTWTLKNKRNLYAEDSLVDYFEVLALTCKWRTQWAIYGMLKVSLKAKCNMALETFHKLRSFLKQQAHAGEEAVFSVHQVRRFLNKAPDDHKYLTTKVALIMGFVGGCSATELHLMKVRDVRDRGDELIHVNVAKSKITKEARQFEIRGAHYHVVKKYMNQRPPNLKLDAFLIQNFRSDLELPWVPIGICRLRTFGKAVATFLNLPNPELYVGLCLKSWR